jgi:ABC-type transporter MlaC component
MKRLLALLSALILCGMQLGCATDPRDDAINGVVTLMNAAAGDVALITKEVEKAIKKTEQEKAPFDLSEAIKATQKLEKTGRGAQDVKVKQVDNVKPATDEEKAQFAQDYRPKIMNAYADLIKQKAALNEVLRKAETFEKEKVDELRTKIREAEAPFEAIDRQLG